MTNAVHQSAPEGPPVSTGRLVAGTAIAGGAGTILVGEALGEDPAGLAYRGERRSDGPPAPVLIQVLDPGLPVYEQAQWDRLCHSVALVAGLQHKALLPVLELLSSGPLALLVSEAPSGQSLRQMIEKKRKAGQPMSLRGAHNVIASVCNLLTYAHGVLPHGALCPEFIDVSGTGQVRVGGLGIGGFVPPARLLAVVPGGGSYLAPERHAGGPASALADVYAIGAILYECLTLQPAPLGAEAERARPSAHNREVPAAIDGIVCRCMRLDLEARYASPQALKEALATAIDSIGKNTSSHRLGAASARPTTVAGIPALELASAVPLKISVQMPAVGASSGPAPVAPPRPVRPTPSLAAPAAAAGEAAQHMAHTPVKGSPKIPPPGSPPSNPRSLGPPGFPLPPPPLGGLPMGSPSGPRPAVGLDEDAERFLIQKEDKMTYGPFAMREIRSQIEKGTITADHIIEDQETADRRRVREHPLLGEMSREWEGRHAQAQLELRAEAERARHRASVQKSLSGIFIVVLLIGAGVAGYFKFVYKPAVKTVVVKEQGDDFFKGVEIAMKVDPPVKKERHKGPAKRVMKNGKWVDEINLGDASSDGGDETLTAEQVQGVMNRNFKLLGGCLREEAARNPETKKMDLEFQILGNGTVGSVKVNGETGSTAASCVFAKMQAVQFPKFNGTKTHAAFSLALK